MYLVADKGEEKLMEPLLRRMDEDERQRRLSDIDGIVNRDEEEEPPQGSEEEESDEGRDCNHETRDFERQRRKEKKREKKRRAKYDCIKERYVEVRVLSLCVEVRAY